MMFTATKYILNKYVSLKLKDYLFLRNLLQISGYYIVYSRIHINRGE